MIQLRDVTKSFGNRLALDRLSLEVPPGEIFGLLGHNGAGKSTAIGIILGQVWPTAGDVEVGGFQVFRDRRRALMKVGAIFESPAFYDYLSGWRNLEIFSQYSQATPAGRIREVLQWVGLEGREESKVKTYSHGMRARLALAQALLPEPELLILDEPGDGLDPEGIHELRETILRLHRELGLTILLSSHLLHEVEQVCTRIAVLNQGRKVFEGRLEDIKPPGVWFRLNVSDFSTAADLLRAAGLLHAAQPPNLISLAPGAGSDRMVRCLVEGGLAVFEVAAETRNLETFYLSLMKAAGNDLPGTGEERRTGPPTAAKP